MSTKTIGPRRRDPRADLWRLSLEWAQIVDALTAVEGELDPALEYALERLSVHTDDDAGQAVRAIHALEREAEACRAESKHFAERARQREAAVARLRDLLRDVMCSAQRDRLDTPLGPVVLSAPPQVVEVEDEGRLPPEFLRVTTSPDRPAIKKALRAGDDVPGARLANGKPVLRLP